MPNPPGKGHFFGADRESGHFEPPTIGSKSQPYKGPDVTVDSKHETIAPVKTGSGMETDVSQRGTEKHPVDFYQNQGDAGSRGEEIPFRTDLPSSDQMFDEKGNLKPEIRSETDKATQLSNEIPKIQAAEREKGLQVRGPAGATMEDQSGGGEVVGDGVNSDAFFNQNEERSIK